jgi:hypothetical protein
MASSYEDRLQEQREEYREVVRLFVAARAADLPEEAAEAVEPKLKQLGDTLGVSFDDVAAEAQETAPDGEEETTAGDVTRADVVQTLQKFEGKVQTPVLVKSLLGKVTEDVSSRDPEYKAVRSLLDDMHEDGIIERENHPHHAPLVWSVAESAGEAPGGEEDLDVDEANDQPAEKLLSVDHYIERARAVRDGEATPGEVVQAVENMIDHEEAIRKEIAEETMDEIRARFSIRKRSDRRKDDLVNKAYLRVLKDLVPTRSFSYDPFSESVQEAVLSVAEQVDEQQIEDFAEEMEEAREEAKERREKIKQAVQDPQSVSDYRTFVRAKGRSELTDRQKLTFDALKFEEKLDRKRDRERRNIEVTGLPDTVEFSLVEAYHEKRDIPLWVVQLSDRVEKFKFKNLKRSAKTLGGWYSSYSRGDAKPGFQFESEDAAQAFMQAQTDGEVPAELLQWRQKEIDNAENIREVARRTKEDAEDTLGKDRKTNTSRRVSIARSVESEAREQIQLAETMMNVADALESGDVKFLGGLRYRTDFETLETHLQLAHNDWARDRTGDGPGGKRLRDVKEENPIGEISAPELLQYVEYAPMTLRERTVADLVDKGAGVSGAKRITKYWRRRLDGR